MKKSAIPVLLIAGLLLAGMGIKAQEFYYGIERASAISAQYHRPLGLCAGYVFLFKQDKKLIVDFTANYSHQTYNVIKVSHVLGSSFDVRQVKPQNWWFSLSSSFNFRVFSGSCLVIRMGPQVSLNYFLCKEQVRDIPTATQPDRTYLDKNRYLNRPGLGGNLELEFKGLLEKNVSIITSFTPQIIAYGKFLTTDTSVEGAMLTIASRLGLRYRLF
jgi:hypothetical protein